MTIQIEFLARRLTKYGHLQLRCPICGKWQYNTSAQIVSHIHRHTTGYLLNNGEINDKRNAKVMEINNRKRIEALELVVFGSVRDGASTEVEEVEIPRDVKVGKIIE